MTSTIDQRVAALPPYVQKGVLQYLEYLEWKANLPSNRMLESDLGERMRAVREALKQSMASAAHTAGVTLVTYEQYERGVIGRWATNKIRGYCEAWNVSFGWLMEGTGTMFTDDKPPQIEPSSEPIAEASPAKRTAPRRQLAATAANVVSLFPRARS